MTGKTDMTISRGFAPQERTHVARLYWQAFGAKLGRVMRPEARALCFFERVLNPDFALVARNADGALLGVAGFKTSNGALIEGGFSDLRHVFGVWGAAWRAAFLALLERPLEPGTLLMDGIFVDQASRGQGVGGALLDAIFNEARAQGAAQVRLDVIDTNPRARALYERKGFEPVGQEHIGPFRWVFGFRTATRMLRDV